MLSCKDISQITSELLDGKLSFSMRIKVKLHLFMCNNCRNFVKQMHTTVDAVKQLKPEEPKEEIINQQVKTLLDAAKKLDSNNTSHK